MATLTITFTNKLNTSLQVGDIAYSNVTTMLQDPTGGAMLGATQVAVLLGPIFNISGLTIKIQTAGVDIEPIIGDYVFFSKNKNVNTSSLVGYYADVKIENNSKDKVELFSIGSEISESSK